MAKEPYTSTITIPLVLRRFDEQTSKMLKKNRTFSPEGLKEIGGYFDLVFEQVQKCSPALINQDPELPKLIIAGKKALKEEAENASQSHFKRLNKGVKPAIETMSIHLDTIQYLERIGFITINIAKSILNTQFEKKQYVED